jgi:50S ribosomal subunit-associated GTPase HflX
LPYDSIAVSARENLGIDELKRRILRAFQNEFFFCSLFVPYTRLNEYAEIKRYITERSIHYTDDGQEIEAVVPTYYAKKATPFIVKKHKI